MFLKTANVAIENVWKINEQKDDKFVKASAYFKFRDINLSDVLKEVAQDYCISLNPSDYVIVVARAVTANIPNENKDAFHKRELLDMKDSGIFTYETFKFAPLLEEHNYSNVREVCGGIILDSYYDDRIPTDEKVLTLVAVDGVKKRAFVESLVNDKIGTFSMGCVCERTRCSVCNNLAFDASQFCWHVRNKFAMRDAFEWCEGVIFRELSIVSQPADSRAISHVVCFPRSNDDFDIKKFNKEVN